MTHTPAEKILVIQTLQALLQADVVKFHIDDPAIKTGVIPVTGTPIKTNVEKTLQRFKAGEPVGSDPLLQSPRGFHLPAEFILGLEMIDATTGQFRAGKPIFHLQKSPNVAIG